MKKLMTIIFLFVAFNSYSQVDTSKLIITLTLKQKHIAYMGDDLSKSNTLADLQIRDSLIKYLGSGNSLDSVVTVKLKAGQILKFVQATMNDQSGNVYAMINEMATGTVAANGWQGLVGQLIVKKSTANGEQGVSIWLYDEIAGWFGRHQAVLAEKLNSGKTWLKSPIIYN